jgi:D-methionine transport system permease protein
MSNLLFTELLNALWETLYMVIASGTMSVIFGLPLGIILLTTRKQGLLEHVWLNKLLTMLTNALRSVPFIILLVALIPLTRWLTGTSIGTTAAIVPLSIGAIPFVARIVENAIAEVNAGLVEAGLAMGATPFQIIFKILLPEAMTPIINGLTVTLVSLVGYSAMAGAIGGGGLGDLAIRYGYQRFDIAVMSWTVVLLIILVQSLQYTGDFVAKRFSH